LIRRALHIVALVAVAAVLGGCGDDDPLHPDWDQLTFPDDVEVSEPVEVPSGVTSQYLKYAVVTSTSGLDAKGLARQLRLKLEDEGWEISGRGDIRPGFSIDAPDSNDDGEVAPLRALDRYLHGYRGRVGELIRSTPGAKDGVIVALSGWVPQPDGG
jgi:hypothetical protein